MGSIPESGKSPGEENGNSLQYSCLENSMDRGVQQATVHGASKESDTTKHTHTHIYVTSMGQRVYMVLLYFLY